MSENTHIPLPQLKPFKNCKLCHHKHSWRTVLLYQIFSFLMTPPERDDFYLNYGSCIDCAWYFAHKFEKQ